MDVSRTKICLNTSISATSNSERREYKQRLFQDIMATHSVRLNAHGIIMRFLHYFLGQRYGWLVMLVSLLVMTCTIWPHHTYHVVYLYGHCSPLYICLAINLDHLINLCLLYVVGCHVMRCYTLGYVFDVFLRISWDFRRNCADSWTICKVYAPVFMLN